MKLYMKYFMCNRYREVTGSNALETLNFSGFYIRNCINCVHNYEDHSLLDFTFAVQYMKYFIYNFTLIFFYNICNNADECQENCFSTL